MIVSINPQPKDEGADVSDGIRYNWVSNAATGTMDLALDGTGVGVTISFTPKELAGFVMRLGNVLESYLEPA